MKDKTSEKPDENLVDENLNENAADQAGKERQADPMASFMAEMEKMRKDMKKEAQKILQDAQKSADEIVENAKVAAEQINKARPVEGSNVGNVGINAKAENKPQEMVPIKLFKDGGRYKNDLVVALNGTPYAIQRGKTVMVPRGVAEIIESSLRQDIDAALYREQQEEAYAATLK